MNLLASVIPGVREIRAPLIAGYMWLIFAWLVIEPEPDLADATGIMESLVELADTAGPVATAAAVSVVAYLLGALQSAALTSGARVFGAGASLISTWRRERGRINAPDEGRQPPGDAGPENPVSPGEETSELTKGPVRRTLAALVQMLRPRATERKLMRDRDARDRENYEYFRLLLGNDDARSQERARNLVLDNLRYDWSPVAADTRDLISHAWPSLSERERLNVMSAAMRARSFQEIDVRLPATVLLGDQPQLHAEADRLSNEAEFRLAIALPLAALIGVVVAEHGPEFLLLLIVPYLLRRQARESQTQSEGLVRTAIANGKIPSPAMTQLKQEITALTTRALRTGDAAS